MIPSHKLQLQSTIEIFMVWIYVTKLKLSCGVTQPCGPWSCKNVHTFCCNTLLDIKFPIGATITCFMLPKQLVKLYSLIDSTCVAVGLIYVLRTFPCLKFGSCLVLGILCYEEISPIPVICLLAVTSFKWWVERFKSRVTQSKQILTMVPLFKSA